MHIKKRSPESFYYSGGKTGILLIHGFTGTPSELRPLGKFLSDKGYTVYAPLLKGHGVTPEEMQKTCWTDWWESTLSAYKKLKDDVEKVVVIGLSMGGCLALYLSTQVEVDGVISLCSPIWVRDRRFPFSSIGKHFMKFIPRVPNQCPDIESHIYPYDRTPVSCVDELRRFIRIVRKSLSKVTTPALVVQSEKDETVLPKSGSYIYRHISSDVKDISWYAKSGHIIVLDKERQKLFEEIFRFVDRLSQETSSKE